jgi:hypothetical protein
VTGEAPFLDHGAGRGFIRHHDHRRDEKTDAAQQSDCGSHTDLISIMKEIRVAVNRPVYR